MPRRKKQQFIRDIGVDVRFKSPLVQKFINVVMERGKKQVAQRIVYDALEIIIKKNDGSDKKGCEVFERAIEKLRPAVEVKSRRVGGGMYQVPTEVRPRRAQALAFRWLISAAADRKDKTMGERIASELLDAIEGRGNAVKKKLDVHRMAEANRAFAHYAW